MEQPSSGESRRGLTGAGPAVREAGLPLSQPPLLPLSGRAALASLHRTAGPALDDHALGLAPTLALQAPLRLLLMQEPTWKELTLGER